MDELIGAIFRALYHFFVALIYWRVLLCATVAFFVSVLLARLSLGINAFQGMVFVLIAWLIGMAWTDVAEVSRRVGEPPKPAIPEQTALWLAALGGTFMGYVWGAISSLTPASAIFGAAVLAVVCRIVYVWRSKAHGFAIPVRYTVVCVAWTWAGFLVPLTQFGTFF